MKSNNVVLAKDGQLLASGVGQTSRVDALKQAIDKAKEFGFDLKGSVMASEAFFPFPDCVEIAGNVGVTAVVQPGGSIKDQLSIDYCNEHNIAMVMTGVRHFLHWEINFLDWLDQNFTFKKSRFSTLNFCFFCFIRQYIFAQ